MKRDLIQGGNMAEPIYGMRLMQLDEDEYNELEEDGRDIGEYCCEQCCVPDGGMCEDCDEDVYWEGG